MRTFNGLRKVVATLRGPEGCPWDRVQTHQSLRPFLLEEASEALEALDEGDPAQLCEELGDLLLEVLLHVQIAEEAGEFRLEDVVYSVNDKLVRRHPHVFADAKAETPEAVVEQWEKLKGEERQGQSALTGIPGTLPSLAYAQAMQKRAHRAGFAWERVEQAWEALEEELGELRAADTPEQRREEVGDALFALAGLAGWLEVDAEGALRSTCRGFRTVFQRLEATVKEEGRELREMPAEEKLARHYFVTLEPRGQLQKHLLIRHRVHQISEPIFADQLRQRQLLQLEVSRHEAQRFRDLIQVDEEACQHVHAARPSAGRLEERILDSLDSVALLHVARQHLLVRSGEETHLTDLAEVHPDRVVDPFLQLGAGCLTLNLLHLLARRLAPLP